MEKQLELVASDIQASMTDSAATWQGLSDLELACVGGGIGDTVL